MPQSLSRVWLHFTFSTKDRQAFLPRLDSREALFRMLGHEIEKAGCIPKCCGGWTDHVHVICGLSRTVTISALIQQIKIETSKWAKKSPLQIGAFSWQQGYGAFSISESILENVIKYVQRQEEHHRHRSFQDEFRELCRKHGLEIDERYVWD
ncbi:transposase [Schlesneria paludicola]|uniref:transposase n=1 Tax=Schlesneria paludicola TaxID=360056 RepID=UPI00029B0C2B|nr:transposase [Schlesneria paludicola]